MSKLTKHVKSDKVKWVFTGIIVVLLAGACATSIAMGIRHNGWFSELCNHEYGDDGICTKCGSEQATIESEDLVSDGYSFEA
jgi:hypothetical protein